MKKKNILYFTRTMDLGGTEKVILQLCEIMKSEFNKIIVCSSGGVNVDRLKKLGIKHYYIPDIEKKNIKTITRVFLKLNKIVKEENIDIIHTHHRMAAFYTRLLNLKKKFLFINNVHNTFHDKKFLTRFAIGKANNIAVGKKVKDNICEFHGISEKNVEIIYNAVEIVEYNKNCVEELKKYKDEGYFLVGNIGRLSKQKGFEYFIEAAKLINKENKKIKFIIVGSGELESKLKEMTKDFNLEDSIIFLGYRDNIANIIRCLDLVVLSSLWEGFPLIPIEAFMQSKTIVATSVDGTNEIVEDYVNGILVEPANSQEIKDAIIKIYLDYNLRKTLESNAYKTYYEKFKIDIFIKNYIEYYKKLIK